MKTAGIAARGRPVPGLRSLRSLRPGTGRTPLFRGRKTTPKGDISELEKRGHLCFGLTHHRLHHRGFLDGSRQGVCRTSVSPASLPRTFVFFWLWMMTSALLLHCLVALLAERPKALRFGQAQDAPILAILLQPTRAILVNNGLSLLGDRLDEGIVRPEPANVAVLAGPPVPAGRSQPDLVATPDAIRNHF